MAQTRDPFYTFQDKVNASLQTLHSQLAQVEEALQLPGSLSNQEIDVLLASAKQNCTDVRLWVKDLEQTITIVEENRSRFPTINDVELDNRRVFVSSSGKSLQQEDQKYQELYVKVQAQQRKALMTRSNVNNSNSRFAPAINAEIKREADDFVSGSHSTQQLLVDQQNLVLDDMSAALSRLDVISHDINKELKEQEKDLNELDEDLDTAQGTMNIVLKKMDKLLKSSDKGRLCCIVILFALVILLLFLIVYT